MRTLDFDDPFADDGLTSPESFSSLGRPVPRITIQAFCDTPEVAGALDMAASDRRMARAHTKVHTGGISAAIDFYQSAPTPNLIIVESRLVKNELIARLDELAEVCDSGTKVLVIGHSNDVVTYRELLKRGVSEYLIAPVDVMAVIAAIADIYNDDGQSKLGQVFAFVGAKGGVGSSTVAHNVAWSMSRVFGSDVIIADLDLAFGTVGLDFNQDPPQGMADAVFGSDRLDEVLLDRLLTKCEEHLSILAAPAMLDKTYDFEEEAFDHVLDILQSNVPAVVLDIPHIWTSWARKMLLAADDVIVTATPDLANLRNAKNLIDLLKQARPNDAPPKLVLNKVGIPRQPEIKVDDFGAALQTAPTAVIPFDPLLFGTAANNGQMIAEASAKSAINDTFVDIAQIVTGRTEQKHGKKGGLSFAPLLEKLSAMQKSGKKTKPKRAA
ncbi:AAA family ATPase [Afifella pfennigii]|uniref:AAA family ATPase n=1 Tax=Afifella pfennigii TaxID=209897 RepID=UPI0006922192|nr:AAA family ATPase [Afifella pfennigii]